MLRNDTFGSSYEKITAHLWIDLYLQRVLLPASPRPGFTRAKGMNLFLRPVDLEAYRPWPVLAGFMALVALGVVAVVVGLRH